MRENASCYLSVTGRQMGLCGDKGMKKSFEEVFEDQTKYGTKVKTEEYCISGAHIIVDQGQGQIAGYTDREDGLFADVPAIVFGDHTRVIKYVDTPFYLGADGVKVLRSRFENANYRYLYYALKSARIPNTGYNRHYKWLKETRINYPDAERQAEIVRILDRVMEVIGKRQQQLNAYDDLIKARFVEMFGDLRINKKGWGLRSFDDLTVLITDGEHATPKRTSEGIYLLSARNILNHAIRLDDVDYIDQEEYDRIAKRVIPTEGDVLISCSGTVGRCCAVPADLKFQMVRSAALLRFKPEIKPKFAEYMITSDFIQEQINQSKTASSQANLFQGKIAKLKGFVPPIDMQEQFTDFISQVDKSKSHKKTNYKTNNKLAS